MLGIDYPIIRMQAGETQSLEQIQRAIGIRDTVDRAKPTGRLAAAPDALPIDTSLLTIDEVCERVREAILVSRNNPGDIR